MLLDKLRPHFTPFWWIGADTRYIEVFSAFAAFIFGSLLLMPYTMFDMFPAYRVMALIMPEWAWGTVFLSVWLVQSYAMCGNVFVARLPGALMAFCVWGFAAGTFFWNTPLGFGPYLYGLIAGFMAWIVVRGPTNGDT